MLATLSSVVGRPIGENYNRKVYCLAILYLLYLINLDNILCAYVLCYYPDCPNGVTVIPKGECCPRCAEDVEGGLIWSIH